MYSAFPLLYLCDSEQRGGKDRGFEGIIRVEVGQFSRDAVNPLDLMPTIFSLVISFLLIDDINYHMHLFATVSNFFSISLNKLQVLLKFLQKLVINSFATHRQ